MNKTYEHYRRKKQARLDAIAAREERERQARARTRNMSKGSALGAVAAFTALSVANINKFPRVVRTTSTYEDQFKAFPDNE